MKKCSAFGAARGNAISPNLLHCQWIEVPEYVFATSALHLQQTRKPNNPGSNIHTKA